MKKIAHYFVVVVVISLKTFAQCPTGLLNISSQSQIDSFPIGCTDLPNPLFISGLSITSLKPLERLKSINGTLQISNTSIEDLQGLENLIDIKGGFQIVDNQKLSNIDGIAHYNGELFNITISRNDGLKTIKLPRIKNVLEEIEINSNQELTVLDIDSVSSVKRLRLFSNNKLSSISPMPLLVSVDEDIYLEYMPEITSVDFLPSLKSVTNLTIRRLNGLEAISSLTHLTDITGDLIILGNARLKTLAGLNGLERTKNIRIAENDSLVVIGEWSKHDSITGDMIIENNGLLGNLHGIGKFKNVHRLYIHGNYSLNNLSGLDSLEIVNEWLLISSNQTMKGFLGLENLKEVTQKLTISGNFSLYSLPNFDSLSRVGSLEVLENINLKSLNGIKKLSTVTDEIKIADNFKLEDISAIAVVQSVKNIIIEGNILLSRLNGFESIDVVDNLTIARNGVKNLTGLDSLRSVNGGISIIENDSLVTFLGLGKLDSVKSNLIVYQNHGLENLNGLTQLNEVGDLFISENNKLKNIIGLGSLKKINNGLTVNACYNLESLDGLNKIDSLRGHLVIMDNYKITNFSGLSGLRYIGQNLSITHNILMETLDGLENLKKVGGSLEISSNPLLSSIDALGGLIIDGVDPVNSPNLSIIFNYALSSCAIESICRYIKDHNSNIYQNGTGCSSPEEVKAMCTQNYPSSRLVSLGEPGTCVSVEDINIDESNKNDWVEIVDDEGYAVAAINANGNILGKVQTNLFTRTGTLRVDNDNSFYLNRNATIHPEHNVIDTERAVKIRLYIRKSEFDEMKYLKGIINPVDDISELGMFKSSENTCTSEIGKPAFNIFSSAEMWHNDFAFTADITSFSTFYISSMSNNILPLRLYSLKATVEENHCHISWETSEEQNVSHFEVQKSYDAKTFDSIGEVEALNLLSNNIYKYIDENPDGRAIYYRLKMVDMDGAFSYSGITSITYGEVSVKSPFLYPNPSRNEIIINSENKKNQNWYIMNESGIIMLKGFVNQDNSVINIETLYPGNYILRLENQHWKSLKFSKY